MITLTGHPQSTIAAASDVVLDVSVKEEACSLNLAPTASTTAAMAMGDALAVSLLDRRGFSPGDFAALHPGGRLGKKLLRVENLMHSGDAMPRVPVTAKMPDVIYEMSKKGLGMTTVVDGEGRLAGILTDGDLRRLMQQRGAATIDLVVGDCMNRTSANDRARRTRGQRPAHHGGAEDHFARRGRRRSGSRSAWCTCTICGHWNCFSGFGFLRFSRCPLC